MTEPIGLEQGEPDSLALLCWHIDRYDRQRASTSSRASVVLSAGAILFAGNTIVLSRLIDTNAPRLNPWVLIPILALATATSTLLVLALLRSVGVLVTPRSSAAMFMLGEPAPSGLIFNGTDTVMRIRTFASFQEAMTSQDAFDVRTAAQLELWIGIQQHRHRYNQLRCAARYLRYSAISFGLVLALMFGVEFYQVVGGF